MELNYATNGKANAALTTGIIGTALGALNSGGGLLGMLGGIRPAANDTVAAAAMLAAANNGCGRYGGNGCCSDDQYITRYELNQQKEIIALEARISEKDSQIALRDANTFTDQKILEVYKYFDGKLNEIGGVLANQAVKNQATADSFNTLQERMDCCKRELSEKINQECRCRTCADNSIVNYVNQTFYPKQVADVTVGTANTPQAVYNPLPINNCGGCGCCNR